MGFEKMLRKKNPCSHNPKALASFLKNSSYFSHFIFQFLKKKKKIFCLLITFLAGLGKQTFILLGLTRGLSLRRKNWASKQSFDVRGHF